jgi:hypothetical protein
MKGTRAMLPCVEGYGGALADDDPPGCRLSLERVPILRDSKLRRARFAATVAHIPAPPLRCANHTHRKCDGC